MLILVIVIPIFFLFFLLAIICFIRYYNRNNPFNPIRSGVGQQQQQQQSDNNNNNNDNNNNAVLAALSSFPYIIIINATGRANQDRITFNNQKNNPLLLNRQTNSILSNETLLVTWNCIN